MRRLMLLFCTLLVVFGMGAAALAADGAPTTKGIVVTPASSSVGVWTDRSEYMVGDPVKISFKSDFEGYAALFDGQGNVVWPQSGANGLVTAGRTYTLPAMTASEPVGTTSLVLVVFKRASLSVWDLIPGITLKPQAVQTDSRASANCSFTVKPRIQMTTLRVNGTPGARVFIDGQDYGTAPLTVQLEVDRHQLVALMPNMVALVRMLTPIDGRNGNIDWQLDFTPIR